MFKRPIAFLLSIAMASLLAMCNPDTDPGDTPDLPTLGVSDQSASDQDQQALQYDPTDLTVSGRLEQYTIAEICAGAREEDPEFDGLYKKLDYNLIQIGSEIYGYRYTYPSVEWDIASVAQYYQQYYWRWVDGRPSAFVETGHYATTWNEDYSQYFVANKFSNWLMVDGVNVYPLDDSSYSMDPISLVEAYQNREWNGKDIRRSDDFSTSVVINDGCGCLEYVFDTKDYSRTDYANLAWSGFNSSPWWRTEGTTSDAPVLSYSCYHGENGDGSTYSAESAHVMIFPDVPLNAQDTLYAVRSAKQAVAAASPDIQGSNILPDSRVYNYRYQVVYGSDGLKAITTNGVRLYRAGVVRQSWDIPVNEDSLLTEVRDRNAVAADTILYSNQKLYRLIDDGTYEVIADKIVDVLPTHFSNIAAFSLDRNGDLTFHSVYDPFVESAVVAHDVAEVRFNRMFGAFYTDKSGTTYAFDSPSTDHGIHALVYEEGRHEVIELGQISIDFCLEAYHEFQNTPYAELYDYNAYAYIMDKAAGTLLSIDEVT